MEEKKDLLEIILSIEANETETEREERLENFKNYMVKRKKPRIYRDKVYLLLVDKIENYLKQIGYVLNDEFLEDKILDYSNSFKSIIDLKQYIDEIVPLLDIEEMKLYYIIEYNLDNIIDAMISINIITNKANRIKTLNNI